MSVAYEGEQRRCYNDLTVRHVHEDTMQAQGEVGQIRTMDEGELIKAGQRGEVGAFNQLVLTYQELVYNVCFRMLGDADSAADGTQDTFLSAYKALMGFRGGSFKSWLLRIATNACYDQLRKRQRRHSHSLEHFFSEGGPQFEEVADDPGPEELAVRRELWDCLQEGLATLAPDQRMAVVLGDVQGLSYEEIAQVTGVALGTVKSRLSRGRGEMRRFLSSHRELLPSHLRLNDSEG